MSQPKASKKPNRGAAQQKEIGVFRGRNLWLAGLVVAILGGAVGVAWDVARPPPPPPPELEAVQTFPDLGVLHLAEGAVVPDYNSDPPTSGPHSATPAPCGIYRQPVPDIAQLHSMEHGAIVIQYDPGLSDGQVQLIEGIDWSAGDEVIVAPRPSNQSSVALTAWTKSLVLDAVDLEVIAAFQQEFGNRAPEGAAPCPMQVDETR